MSKSTKTSPRQATKLVNIKTSNGAVITLPQPNIRCYDIDVNQLLGYGSYGFVFRSKRIGNPNNIYAIKCVLLKRLSKSSTENIINEISILKSLKNRFIVQLHDFHCDSNYIYLVLEYCPGGDLGSLINLKRNFPEEIVQHFLQQLASSMRYLRSHNIAHMDLKPQNILISGVLLINLYNSLNSFSTWQNIVLKIADFGFSQYLSNEQQSQSVRGSPLYMAPEVLLGQQYDARVDLWSLGIIMYECLFGRPPYPSPHTDELIKIFASNKKFQIQLPKGHKTSNNCVSLLNSLLEVDAKDRITFDKFFDHPFLDLEHMPSSESMDKAERLLKEAAQEEKNDNRLQAFYCYREALNYLMPLYRWGDLDTSHSKTKQEALRARIVQYMERAERLYRNLGFSQLAPQDVEPIQKVYDLIDVARQSKEDGQLECALDSYTQAIEQTLALSKKYSNDIRKQFFGELKAWLSEAENVKEMISKMEFAKTKSLSDKRSNSMRVKPTECDNDDDDDNDLTTTCEASKSVTTIEPKKKINRKGVNIFNIDKSQLGGMPQQEDPKCSIQ